MKSIKLTESDAIFVHYVLRQYADQTEGLDSEDKVEIYDVAAQASKRKVQHWLHCRSYKRTAK
jgi:hypothetical protein